MYRRQRTEEEMREETIRQRRASAYESICPNLNRKERRTAYGKMLVAQAEAASLQAEVDFLREELSCR